MLNVLKALSERMGIVKERAPFDPLVFNDLIAVQTGWHPLERGGSSFRTRRLVQIDPDRVEFRPTFSALMFGVVFGGFGFLAIGAAGLILLSPTSEAPRIWALFPFVIGTLFVAVAAWLIRAFSVPAVFDTRNGWFWKGREDPASAVNRNDLKCFVELEEVHALQLISEFCSGGDRKAFFSFELNVVLKSAKRLNVFDHGSLRHARADAAKLAAFLEVPLWDAVR